MFDPRIARPAARNHRHRARRGRAGAGRPGRRCRTRSAASGERAARLSSDRNQLLLPPGIAADKDVSVTGPTPGIEDEPSIAIDPTDPSKVIVGAQRLAGPCTYYESSDGGATWSDALIAPLTPGAGICYDIVARASPDGRFFYLSYLSIANETTDDVAVLRITTDFVTTQGPFVAIAQRAGLIDKDWLDIHGVDLRAPERGVPHGHPLPRGAGLHRYCSHARSTTASIGRRLRYWPTTRSARSLMSGPRRPRSWRAGHERPGVLVQRRLGRLGARARWRRGIRHRLPQLARRRPDVRAPCVRSEGRTRGASRTTRVHIARYHRIWSAMFPAMAIAPDGSAHLTYARDPTISNSER